MSANLDRFNVGVEPSIPDEVGECAGCGGMMYDYEVATCNICDSKIHQGCQVRCDHCGIVGCKSCFEENKETSEWFCCSECLEAQAESEMTL